MSAATSRDRYVLLALVLGAFMTALDATIVSVALPTIARDIGEAGHSTTNISWVLLSYTLMLCCFILLWAKLGTNLGYRRIFVLGISLFTVCSLAIGLCGFLPQLGLGVIILLRAAQGLGAGMAMAMSLAMVAAYLPVSVRGSAIGTVTLAASAGTAFGPAIGGLLTAIHWSLIFFINVPIGLICIALCIRYIQNQTPIAHGRLDLMGAVMLFIMLFALIFYLNQGQCLGWTSETGLGLLLIAAIAGGLAAWWESHTTDPLVSPRLINQRGVVSASLVCLLLFMGMAGSYLLLPYYLQFVQGYSTIEYGFILIANSIGMIAAGPAVGRLTDRRGTGRDFIPLGCLIAAAGFFLITLFGNGTSLWFILLALFVMGAGMGTALVAATSYTFAFGQAGEDGAISGITNTFRMAGSSTGVALLSTVFLANVIVTPTVNLVPGFHHAFFIAIVLSLAAFTVAMSLKHEPTIAGDGTGV